ncbi:nuclear pore complex assembly-domain-containing protein [Mycena crocata]|nr:nuclear pore complex assembly-domain-containing protein [Mycena crocata]
MDLDAPLSAVQQSSATVLSYFDLSPAVFPWRDPRPQQIERRRAALGDLLLFDILLTSGGIRQPDTLYPPVDVAAFHRLLDAIQTSQYDALKRDCLVYFLLKWYQDGREDRYRIERGITPQFSSLADAYWHLDAGMNVPRAVSLLSDARLNTDYASKILQAISLSPNSMPLVLKYVRTAKPLLTEPDDIDMYTIALAESSLLEAWQFQRTFNEKHETRPRLLKKILDWCFSPVPRRTALTQLLGLALTPYEQTIIHSYATPPSPLPPAGIAILQNLICVRLIQTGKYADAIKMDRQFSSTSSVHAERTKMVQDLYAALPLAERTILDLELENPGTDSAFGDANALAGSSSREWDTSMSWEDIRAPPPPVSQALAPIPFLPRVQIPPLTEHSSAPNGGPLPPLRSKFGGFGSGLQAASAFPPLAFNASSSRPHAPIIPVSNVPKSNLAAQPAVPSARQPLNASTNAFSSLSQSATRFTDTSGSSGGPKTFFDSAGRKQNAFYQPPAPAPAPSVLFDVGNAEDGGGRTDSYALHANADIEMDRDVDADSETGKDDHEPTDNGDGLAYSVFGGKPTRSSKRGGAKTRQPSVEAKQVPPGAFGSDDEHDEPEAVDPPPPRQSRRSVAAKAGTAKPAAAKSTRSTATRTRARAKEQELGRSLPGSLMESEDGSADEAENEDEDQLAPLRSRQAATGEGPQTRRRSSRLSSSETESRPEKEKASGRTRSAAGTGRKRRS